MFCKIDPEKSLIYLAFQFLITSTVNESLIELESESESVCTHTEFVLVLGASSKESTNIVQTTYNKGNKKH